MREREGGRREKIEIKKSVIIFQRNLNKRSNWHLINFCIFVGWGGGEGYFLPQTSKLFDLCLCNYLRTSFFPIVYHLVFHTCAYKAFVSDDAVN